MSTHTHNRVAGAALILGGAGLIGREAARLLAGRGRISPIVVADRNFEGARDVAQDINAAHGNRAVAVEIDAGDIPACVALMREARVVLNTTAPFTRHGEPLLRAALEAGVFYADVNDEIESIRAIMDSAELADLAQRAGVAAVVGLGTSPGLTNIVAAHAIAQLDRILSIHLALCTGPWNRSEAVWAHRLRVNSTPATIFRAGAWTEVPAMSEEEVVEFPWPPHRAVVRIVAHPEPLTLARFVPGVQEVITKIGYPERMNRLIGDLVNYGLASEELLDVAGARVAPAHLVARYLATEEADRRLQFSTLRAYSVRQIRVKGTLDDAPAQREHTLTYQLAFRGGAVETALPLVIAAELLAEGRVAGTGIMAPEALDPEPFLAELRALGVKMRMIRDEHDAA